VTVKFDARKIAQKLCDNHDYQAAELVLHEHIKFDRQDEEAIALIGDIFEKSDRNDLALLQFRNAVLLAHAKGKDTTAYDASVARLEALQKNYSGQFQSTEIGAAVGEENSKNYSPRLKPSRRILPYFGFPEIHHDTLTLNEYGYIVQDGFKGKQIPYMPVPGSNEFIVGIFGGSIACAFYKDAVARLTEKLGNHPDLADCTVTVLNFSMGGSKQPESMIAHAYFTAIGQKFDLIINMDGMNDLAGCAGNLHQGHHMAMPPADITNAFLALTAVPDLDVNSLRYFLRLNRYDKLIDFFENTDIPLFGQKSLVGFFRKKRNFHMNQKPKIDIDDNLITIHRIEPDSMLGMNDEDFIDRVRQIRKFWFNCVKNMVEVCRGQGTTYVHAIHPSHFFLSRELGKNDKALAESEPALDWYRRIVGTGFPLMTEQLQHLSGIWHGAHYCELQEVLEDLDDDMLLDRMGHFKAPVNFAMADKIADFVQNKLLRIDQNIPDSNDPIDL